MSSFQNFKQNKISFKNDSLNVHINNNQTSGMNHKIYHNFASNNIQNNLTENRTKLNYTAYDPYDRQTLDTGRGMKQTLQTIHNIYSPRYTTIQSPRHLDSMKENQFQNGIIQIENKNKSPNSQQMFQKQLNDQFNEKKYSTQKKHYIYPGNNQSNNSNNTIKNNFQIQSIYINPNQININKYQNPNTQNNNKIFYRQTINNFRLTQDNSQIHDIYSPDHRMSTVPSNVIRSKFPIIQCNPNQYDQRFANTNVYEAPNQSINNNKSNSKSHNIYLSTLASDQIQIPRPQYVKIYNHKNQFFRKLAPQQDPTYLIQQKKGFCYKLLPILGIITLLLIGLGTCFLIAHLTGLQGSFFGKIIDNNNKSFIDNNIINTNNGFTDLNTQQLQVNNNISNQIEDGKNQTANQTIQTTFVQNITNKNNFTTGIKPIQNSIKPSIINTINQDTSNNFVYPQPIKDQQQIRQIIYQVSEQNRQVVPLNFRVQLQNLVLNQIQQKLHLNYKNITKLNLHMESSERINVATVQQITYKHLQQYLGIKVQHKKHYLSRLNTNF